MCGITGFISNSCDNSGEFLSKLNKMSECLKLRGPDDAGTWFDKEAAVYLAHRRLSILDLSSSGKQPMVSPSGPAAAALLLASYSTSKTRVMV